MDFYCRLKMLVKQHHLNLETLALETNIFVNTIKKWGQESDPSLNNLLVIARFFDVSIDYLTGNAENPKSHKADAASEIEIWKSIKEIAQQKISEAQK